MAKSTPGGPKKDKPDPDDELEKLRALLLTTEQSKIAEVEDRLDKPVRHAEEISRVIAEAILLRAAKDKALAQALQPTLEEALKISVRNNPRFLAESLFPIMGPAIRKAIAEALRGMVQSLDQTMRYAFSWQGIMWRLESLRTGKPFAEVVLLRTLVFSIDQVFLIHKETGLLLAHVSRNKTWVKDADLVSSMLTAVGDFMRDAFSAGGPLDTMQVGGLSVWVEQGAQAVLAVTVSGNPPLTARTTVAEVLRKVEADFSEALSFFTGDNALFKLAEPLMAMCLQEVRTGAGARVKALPQAARRSYNPVPVIVWTALACLLLILIGYIASR